jgi:tetratricopeptide (TPR) repeat protein
MRENRPASNFFSSLAAQCVVVGLMGSCYLLGRMTLPGRIPAAVPPNAAAEGKEPATPLGVPEPAMGVIDQALAAQNAGDSENAFRLLDQLRRDGGHINGLDFQLGWLAYQRGDYPGALLALNRSIAEEEEVGSSYDLRGLIAGGPRPGMTADFEAATQANPFDAIAFFHWGEALRRSGKPRQALIRLRQALDRAQTPATQSLFGLKIRLAEIELGEEKNFAPALAAALARPQPASEWLLTAAAQEMRGGNYSAAAAHLEEARQVSGSAVIGSALLDYFFQGYADKPEMAGVYAEIPGPPMPPMPPAPAAFVGPAGLPAVALPAPIAAPEANRGPR